MSQPSINAKSGPACFQVLLVLTLWLAAQVLPVAHGLHHLLHEDSHSAEHQCPITLAAHASFESTPPGTDVPIILAGFSEVETSYHFSLPPSPSPLRAGRSPPSAL